MYIASSTSIFEALNFTLNPFAKANSKRNSIIQSKFARIKTGWIKTGHLRLYMS